MSLKGFDMAVGDARVVVVGVAVKIGVAIGVFPGILVAAGTCVDVTVLIAVDVGVAGTLVEAAPGIIPLFL